MLNLLSAISPVYKQVPKQNSKGNTISNKSDETLLNKCFSSENSNINNSCSFPIISVLSAETKSTMNLHTFKAIVSEGGGVRFVFLSTSYFQDSSIAPRGGGGVD